MNEMGANVIKLLNQVRTLFRETALLLKTTDQYMADVGWKIATPTNICVQLSMLLDWSHWWFPYFAFRLYKNEQYPHFLSFVAVIFYDRDGKLHVQEPLLSAGWNDYGKGNTVPADEVGGDSVLWHPEMPGRRDDGVLISVDPRQQWPDEKYKPYRTTTLAVPLIEITNAEQLKSRVTGPLLAAIGEQSA